MSETVSELHVVFDANVLMSNYDCAGTAWGVLAQGARAWDLSLWTTEPTVIEAVAGHGRDAEKSLAALSGAVASLEGLGVHVADEAVLEGIRAGIDGFEETYRDRLAARGVEILPTPGVEHLELVRRAAARVPPCNAKGDGYRDTLLWHTVLELAKTRPGNILFVTQDGDFRHGQADDLHPVLLAELANEGLDGRVELLRTVKAAAIAAATKNAIEVTDIADVFTDLRSNHVWEFVTDRMLCDPQGLQLDPRAAALPRQSRGAAVDSFDNVRDRQLRSVSDFGTEGSVATFQVVIDARILVVMDDEADPPTGYQIEEVSDDGGVWVTTKPLQVSGIVNLDSTHVPTSGEITSVDALPDDAGRSAWVTVSISSKMLDDVLKNFRVIQSAQLQPWKDIMKSYNAARFEPVLDMVKAYQGVRFDFTRTIEKSMPQLNFLRDLQDSIRPNILGITAAHNAALRQQTEALRPLREITEFLQSDVYTSMMRSAQTEVEADESDDPSDDPDGTDEVGDSSPDSTS